MAQKERIGMKATVHTHYDNLKVARDAPLEVIRAAYRTLSKKYHPDHNPDNPSAMRITQLVNLAYEVLSDPIRRQQHDEWIVREETSQRVAGTAALGRKGKYEDMARSAAGRTVRQQHPASYGTTRSINGHTGLLKKLLVSCDHFLRNLSHRQKF